MCQHWEQCVQRPWGGSELGLFKGQEEDHGGPSMVTSDRVAGHIRQFVGPDAAEPCRLSQEFSVFSFPWTPQEVSVRERQDLTSIPESCCWLLCDRYVGLSHSAPKPLFLD